LLNLDARDLLLWTKLAKKQSIYNRIESYNASRVGMAKDEDYRLIQMQLEWQLNLTELTDEELEAMENPVIVKPGEN